MFCDLGEEERTKFRKKKQKKKEKKTKQGKTRLEFASKPSEQPTHS